MPIKRPEPDADADTYMHLGRAAIAAVLISLVVVLARSNVVAAIVVGTLLVALAALIFVGGGKLVVAARKRFRQEGASRVPWGVSLVVSAVVTAPQFGLAHFKHAWAGLITGILWWLSLAAFLRLVIFLTDFLRRRRNGRLTKPSSRRKVYCEARRR